MGDLILLKPEAGHVEALSARPALRDRRECYDLLGLSVREALEVSLAASIEAQAVLWRGRPVALFGLTAQTPLSRKAAPWCLTSSDLEGPVRRRFWAGRRWVDRWATMAPRLENWISADNAQSIRWLERCCGFTVDPPQPRGPFGRAYRRFWREG